MVLEMNENILKISGDASLSDIYSKFPDYGLYIEPLSSKMPLRDFVSRGGFGYGTLREGPFNSKIFRIKWKRPKYSFKYGLMDSTLYAAGYPLHRMTSALPHKLYNKSLGEIQEIVIPVRPKEEFRAIYKPEDSFSFNVPSMARDVIFVNTKAASLVGLPGQGTVIVYPPAVTSELVGVNAEGFIQKRFIEDNLGESKVLWVLTQKSGAAKLYELAGAVASDNLFFALSVNIGLLVMVTGEGIEEKLAEMPLTYRIGNFNFSI